MAHRGGEGLTDADLGMPMSGRSVISGVAYYSRQYDIRALACPTCRREAILVICQLRQRNRSGHTLNFRLFRLKA